MKILYVSKGAYVDYQSDCLLIGLKELFGADVIDIHKHAHIYDTFSAEEAAKHYGKGMTVTRLLPDLEIDRTNIESKIKNRYFDYIIYGSVWRNCYYLNEALEYYPPNKIIIIDGEDETWFHHTNDKNTHYFKRELIDNSPRFKPISFAIPTSKISFNTDKTRDNAFITPLDKSTYIYNNEADYYADYNTSRFGITVKKAGWDCLRHYEIIANGCIPIFSGIEQCPTRTMVDFPKQECIEVIKALNSGSKPETVYNDYIEKFRDKLYKHLTTKAIATKLLNSLQ